MKDHWGEGCGLRSEVAELAPLHRIELDEPGLKAPWRLVYRCGAVVITCAAELADIGWRRKAPPQVPLLLHDLVAHYNEGFAPFLQMRAALANAGPFDAWGDSYRSATEAAYFGARAWLGLAARRLRGAGKPVDPESMAAHWSRLQEDFCGDMEADPSSATRVVTYMASELRRLARQNGDLLHPPRERSPLGIVKRDGREYVVIPSGKSYPLTESEARIFFTLIKRYPNRLTGTRLIRECDVTSAPRILLDFVDKNKNEPVLSYIYLPGPKGSPGWEGGYGIVNPDIP